MFTLDNSDETLPLRPLPSGAVDVAKGGGRAWSAWEWLRAMIDPGKAWAEIHPAIGSP